MLVHLTSLHTSFKFIQLNKYGLSCNGNITVNMKTKELEVKKREFIRVEITTSYQSLIYHSHFTSCHTKIYKKNMLTFISYTVDMLVKLARLNK